MRVGLHLLAAMLLVPAARAVEDEPAPAYRVERWGTDEGLPQNSVTAIVQTRDGYLWLGTHGGLARFDGVRFTVFDISNTEALGSNRILSLLEDSRGALWIGTQDGGITRYEDGVFRHFGEADGAPGGDVFAIAEDGGGVVWFGGLGLTRYAEGRFEQRFPRAASSTTYSIRVEGPETLWLGTGAGAVHYARGSARTYTTADGLPANLTWWVDRDSEGVLWACTGAGLAALHEGRFTPLDLPEGTDPGVVRGALVDGAGRHWIAGERLHRLGSFSDERPFHRVDLGLEVQGVLSVAGDREKNLWIGTGDEGLARLRASAFTFLDARHGISSTPSLVVAGPDADAVWIRFGESLVRTSGTAVEPAPDPVAEAFGGPQPTLHVDRAGTVWVLDDVSVTRIPASGEVESFEHGVDGVFAPIVEDSAGALWFGSRNALCSLRGSEVREHALPPGRAGPVRVHAGEAGRLWLDTPDGIGLFESGTVEFLDLESFPEGRIRGMLEADEALWITTYGSGLGRWSDGTLAMFTAADGLPDNSLGGILEDGSGHLWINSNRGVFCVGPEEVDARARGSKSEIACRLLRTGEGNGGSACKTADGRMWFPTLYGVAIVDPRRVSENTVPPLIAIERVEVAGEARDLASKVVVPPGVSDLVIDYTGLSFVDPRSVRFRYRLAGGDEEWVDAGTRRRAHYTHVPPGSYRFEVSACNEDGLWSEAGDSLDLVFRPHFYETGWFLGVCLVAVGVGLFSFYQARTRSIRSRNFALRREIGERQRAEAALRESEERYRVVAEAATDAILTVDEEGRIGYANPATERVFGCPPEEAIGRRLSTVMPSLVDEGPPFERDELWEGRELVGRHEDGHRFPVEVSLGVLHPRDGAPRFACIVRDITERRRTEEERARLEERLRESKKMEAMGRLAGGISHDFNNILTAMISHAELLDDGVRRGTMKGTLEHVAEIRKCTELAFSLTSQLLAFSRRQVVQRVLLEPSEVLGRLEPMLRRLIREDIDMVVDASPRVGPIRADLGQLEQIIMNLVLNGCDAMPEGGRLSVRAVPVDLDEVYAACNPQASVGPHVLIAVSDTGVGIPEDVLPHLFEPFFTTKSVGHGTGLGLASVHGIVQQSGGHVTVTSEPGKGSTFRIYLPREESEAQAFELPRPEVLEGESLAGTETVLVCDDYAAVRRATQMILANHGYEALSADGPEEALRIAREHGRPIQILVTDVVMPGMNGPQLAQEIGAFQPDIRVLYVSGYTSDVVIHDGAADRAAGFLQKPFVFKKLLRRIRELLDAPVESR